MLFGDAKIDILININHYFGVNIIVGHNHNNYSPFSQSISIISKFQKKVILVLPFFCRIDMCRIYSNLYGWWVWQLQQAFVAAKLLEETIDVNSSNPIASRVQLAHVHNQVIGQSVVLDISESFQNGKGNNI